MTEKFTIYLVDDDPGVLKALSRLLRARDYEVKPYSSPQLFLAEHDVAVPGCAVLDVAMPGLDGLELQRVLTASAGSHRPVVFITGKGDIPTSVRAMKAGAIDFLTKPVNDTDLFEAISHAEASDAQSRRLQLELESIQAKMETLNSARTRSSAACCRRTAQQADCGRSGYRREDHQGSPQPDDGETGRQDGSRSRSYGRGTQSFEVGKRACWPKGQLDGRPARPQ